MELKPGWISSWFRSNRAKLGNHFKQLTHQRTPQNKSKWMEQWLGMTHINNVECNPRISYFYKVKIQRPSLKASCLEHNWSRGHRLSQSLLLFHCTLAVGHTAAIEYSENLLNFILVLRRKALVVNETGPVVRPSTISNDILCRERGTMA